MTAAPRQTLETMHFDTAQISLTGDRRENQDRTKVLGSGTCVLAIVADGMGGHAHGALAAETAITTLTERFREERREDDPAQFLATALTAAHRAVFALGENLSFAERPGTTIVCALAAAGKLWWVNIGDSRAYHLRAGRLLDRTRDHTRIEEQLAAGEITHEEALEHPERHVIEHCLGIREAAPPVEVSAAQPLRAGDLVLLCSDGLWGQIGEAQILERLNGADRLAPAVRRLAKDAARNGHPHGDNVSVVALRAKTPQ